MLLSIVIPVFNSAQIVGATIDRVKAEMVRLDQRFELILVNDASTDGSWEIIKRKAQEIPEVVAINLLRNYGQHTANLCGFENSSGDYIVTMDDDLQNPPEEIEKLLSKATEGYDLVIGNFEQKKHSLFRRLGSKAIGAINRRIFHNQKDLILTNFRLIHRDVIDRVCAYNVPYPYVPGLVLMFSNRRANIAVKHDSRSIGESNYTLLRIVKLIATIMFNYSSLPLRIVAGIGLLGATISIFFGLFVLTKAVFSGTTVPGWATIVVMLAFFNGISLLILGMLGEYLVRLLRQVSSDRPYHANEIER